MRKVIGVLRAQEYSPGAVERDEAIMRAVVEPLYGQLIMEENVTEATDFADCIVFSMARRPETLQVLSRWESFGVRVINPTAGVMNCRRSIVEHIMRKHHLPCPPSRGQYGYWLKRGDMAVTVDNGIAYCRNEKELEDAKSDFAERGITDIVVQAHVRGDVVKFYGVEPKGFFRVYHVDDNESHYFYQKQVLQANAELLARLVGVQVYGGDAVITADGDAYIVDFNDWPSFSRCLCEAAEAIVKMVR